MTVRVGVSGATGDQMNEGADPVDPEDDFREDFKRMGGDVQVDHSRLFVNAEYVRGTNENPETGESDEPRGYYVNVVGKTPWQVGPLVRLDTLNFVRLKCEECGERRLVAFSCKGRGFCPSCTGRRMNATAANLIERVLPPQSGL